MRVPESIRTRVRHAGSQNNRSISLESIANTCSSRVICGLSLDPNIASQPITGDSPMRASVRAFSEPLMPASIEDRLALQELSNRYARAVDRRDYAAFVALFAANGVLCGPGYAMTAHAEIERGIRLIEQYEATQHCVHNQLVDVRGDAASGETYCVARHIYERDGVKRKLDMGVRYQDEYRRDRGGWRFTRRELVLDWTQDLPLTA
jgi:hypothetical protein